MLSMIRRSAFLVHAIRARTFTRAQCSTRSTFLTSRCQCTAFSTSSSSLRAEFLPETIKHRRQTAATDHAPNPRLVFNNFYELVRRHFENGDKLKPVFKYSSKAGKGKHQSWSVTCRVAWPTAFEAAGHGSSKKLAENAAVTQILNHLYAAQKIKDGKPVFFSEDERLQATRLMKEPVQVTIPADVGVKIDELHDDHVALRQALEPWLKAPLEAGVREENYEDYSEEWTADRLMKRNEYLRRKMRLPEDLNEELPIIQHRSKIEQAVANHRVVVLSGDTGCGKSTQVPQLILDELISRGEGTEANIVVAQPRRISAIALARRIASERREKVGDTVGYHVRLEAQLPRHTKGSLLLCTGGILLRKIIGNPTLEGVSHVIIDEAHERDITTDVLMVFLRRAIRANPDLKVVVMSATINVGLFSQYFDGAPIVEVPGRMFPVDVSYLDNLVPHLYPRRTRIPDEVRALLEASPRPVESSRRERSLLSTDLVASAIAHVHQKRPPGAILVFLPGWQEIKAVMSELEDERLKNVLVVPVHSKLSTREQDKIFSRPPDGIRKIVLATNIAETSITIDDVRYVVDTGYHRQNIYDPSSGVEYLATSWVSKANADQRKGRAGRVASGECYRLYPKSVFETLEPFQKPEMLRSALERVVLDVKALSVPGEKVSEFFGEALEAPDEANVERALMELRDDGFLNDDESLTALGRVLTPCPTHPKLAKALAYAALFRCFGPVLNIVSALSSPREILLSNADRRKDVRELKRKYHSKSDHLSVHYILEECKKLGGPRGSLASHCYENWMHFPTVKFALDLAASFTEYLGNTGLHDRKFDGENDGDENVVLAALAAGFGSSRLLKVKHGELHKGYVDPHAISVKTESRRRAVVGSDSVFAGSKDERSVDMSTTCLMGFVQMESVERQARLLRDLSQITPLAPLLVCDSDVRINEVGDEAFVSFAKSHVVRVACDRQTAESIHALREMVKFLAHVFVAHTCGRWDLDQSLSERLDRHRDAVVELLKEALKAHVAVNPVSKIPSTSRVA